jgi:hypothetical protein
MTGDSGYGIKRITLKRFGEQTVNEGLITIHNDSRGYTQSMLHWLRSRKQAFEAELLIEIDMDKLIALVAKRATFNKSGRAVLGSFAKAMRKRRTILNETVVENPIPAGWVTEEGA